MASQGACRVEGVVADDLCGRFAGDPAQETFGSAVACGAGVYGFACVFVLG